MNSKFDWIGYLEFSAAMEGVSIPGPIRNYQDFREGLLQAMATQLPEKYRRFIPPDALIAEMWNAYRRSIH